MHCPNCGKETAADVKFCRACGMKLDLVSRVVSEHKGEQTPEEAEPKETGQKGSEARAVRNIFLPILAGFIIVFIGAVIAVLGKQIDPWVKTVGALIALFGVFATIFGVMYATYASAREGEKTLRPASPKNKPTGELEESAAGELPSGEDFRPASVTEGTTRELDKARTKVLRK